MKKKSLLLILMMAYLMPWAAYAQQTLTVYEGETGSSNRSPIYNFYFDEYTRAQTVFPAEDLDDMIGGTITAIKFYTKYTNNYETDVDVDVYLTEVTEASITSLMDLDNTTIVYTGHLTFEQNPDNGNQAEVTIVLSTPYTYVGGNLLFGCDNKAKGDWENISFYGKYMTGVAVYGNSSSGTPTSSSSNNLLPTTTFTYTPDPSGCNMPTAIAVNAITINSATVTWEGDGSEWNLHYKTASDNDFTLVEGLTDKTYTFNESLESNTTYHIGVQTVCGDTTSVFRQVIFTTDNPCAAPTGLVSTDITTSSASISWTAGYQETSWTVAYKTQFGTKWMEETTDVTSLELTGLESGKQYIVRVYNCENYVEGTFTTIAAIPFTEDFNGTSMPSNWKKYSGLLDQVLAGSITLSSGSNWSFGSRNNVFNNHAYLNIYGNDCKSWLVSPSMPMYDNVQLSFDIALTQYSGATLHINDTLGADDKFAVLITTDNGSSWTVLRQWDNVGSEYVYNNIPNSATGQHQKIDLSSYAGQEIAIAFYGESSVNESGSDNNLHLDNVSINFIPSCEVPRCLTNANITGYTADLSWESEASAWVVAYKASNETAFTEVDVTENPYTLTGLTPETAYTVKVRANCGGDYSEWCVATSFTTDITCFAPTGLKATLTPGDGSIATLRWTEEGSASEWVLHYSENQLFTSFVEISDGFTTEGDKISIDITGLTPETKYYARVKSVCGGIDGASSWSNVYEFIPTDSFIVIANDGDDTNNYIPFYGYYADDNTNSQFIIPASELDELLWGYIDKLTFFTHNVDTLIFRNAVFDVYLTETSDTVFENPELVDWSLMTKVYSGGVSINEHMMEIPLSEPYHYLGDNLMIGFHETINASNYQTIFWYGVDQTTNTSVYKYSNNEVVNSSFLPKTAIEFTPGTEPTCPKPLAFHASYNHGTTATLSWNGNAGSYNLDVNGTLIEGVTSPYVLENLELSTTYQLKVQADCGESQSDWSNTASFTTPSCWDGRIIEFTLHDSYGDGWNDCAIDIYEGCDTIGAPIAHLTISSGHDYNGTLNLCGDTYLFVWVNGGYSQETSWRFAEGDNVLCEGLGEENMTDGAIIYNIGVPMPTDLYVSDVTNHEATISWTSEASAWEIQLNNDEPIYVESDTYTLTNLAAETLYTVKVRAYVSSTEQSCWSEEVIFITDVNCLVSNNLIASDITHNSATLSWAGTSDSYNIRYTEHTANNTTFSFEESGNLEGWTTIDADGDGFNWTQHVNDGNSNHETHTGDGIMTSGSYYSPSQTALFPDNYLVSPQVELGGIVSFWACAQDVSYPDEHFGLAVSTTGNTSAADFITIQEWTMTAKGNRTSGAYYQYTVDLGDYSGMGYVAIRHFNCTDQFYLNVDDIVITGASAVTWNTATSTDTSVNICGLASGKTYDFQVQGICGGELSAWSTMATFTTQTYTLWEDEWATVPTISESVTISDIVVIPSGYTAYANEINIGSGAQLIIEDGGQLIHTGDVTATMQKGITAYTSKDSDGWYLISTPVDGVSTSAVTTGTYDLFIYNEPNAYWYSNTGTAAPFNTLERTKGYLYANSENQTLNFKGEIIGTETPDIPYNLSYACDADPDLKGFNLVGNPFSRNLKYGDIKIGNVNVTTYYATDGGSNLDERNINEAPIKPGQGFMVQANAENQQLVFNPSSKDGDENNGYIKIVAGNGNDFDNAFIQIANGNTLRKMSIANSTEVYVMNDGDDYAAARVEELAGAMPVNFKAITDGEYTITVNAKNIEASTLILFDDFTGESIDLLENPCYTFKAETTDAENRFKLIFDFNYNGVEDNFTSEIFVYQNGDELIVNGEGTLQVFDVLGRIVMNKRINGVESYSRTSLQTGVYIFRLNEHTQKIIIK